jgi:transposase
MFLSWLFRLKQLIGEILMFYLGIDVSKSSSRYVMLDNEGEKFTQPFSLSNDKDSFAKLLLKIEKLNIKAKNILAGIEATGIWWENLYSFLTDNGFKVIVLNPYQTNKFREALRFKAKTDDIDAYVIAGLLRSNEYAENFVPEENIQSLREFTKLRYEFIKNKAGYERQAISLLSLIFPEYAKTAIKNPFAVASMAILKQYPTAKHLSLAKPKDIEKIVRSIKGNNFNINEINHLIEAAKNSIYSGRAKTARGLNLSMILAQIKSLNDSISTLDDQIKDILDNDKNDNSLSYNLSTIPGVGQKTIAAVLSALGSDAKTFSSSKKFIGYIGFFPQIYESGETRRDNLISNRGPKYLRWAFYISAVACLRHNNELRTVYYKKLSQGKSSKQALICVAKKLALIMFSIIKSGKPYDPNRVFVCS